MKFKVLIRKNPVTEHVSRAGLNRMLCQEPGCELCGGFPDHGVEARVEAGELGPQPHQTNPAVDLHRYFLKLKS